MFIVRWFFKIIVSFVLAAVLLVGGSYALSYFAPSVFMAIFTQFVPLDDIRKKVAADIASEKNQTVQKMVNEKVKSAAKKFNLKDIQKRLASSKSPYLEDTKLRIQKFTANEFDIEVNEKDFMAYLQGSGELSDVSVKFLLNNAVVSRTVDVLGRNVLAEVHGHFVVENKTKVRFVGDKLYFSKASVPAPLQKEILSAIQPVVDFSGMDVPLTLKEVKIYNGYFRVSGMVKGS